MSTPAIVMMLVAMAVIWGGLALAIASLVRHGAVEDRIDGAPRAPGGSGAAERR
jgi:hypothetical protein